MSVTITTFVGTTQQSQEEYRKLPKPIINRIVQGILRIRDDITLIEVLKEKDNGEFELRRISRNNQYILN